MHFSPQWNPSVADQAAGRSDRRGQTRAGFDGHRKRKGSMVCMAVDTPGHLLAVGVTAANQQDRAQVGQLAQAVQAAVEEPSPPVAFQRPMTNSQFPILNQSRPLPPSANSASAPLSLSFII